MKNKKFVVITSINNPTLAVEEFSKWNGWTTIVVGDRKSPTDWMHSNVVYLSLDDQISQFPVFSKFISENTYLRKMIGYLYAFRNGAEAIFESDDDNIPYPDALFKIDSDLSSRKNLSPVISSETGWANIYKEFGAPHCWPRGYPLAYIQNSPYQVLNNQTMEESWSVMQYLADNDPDVDAIYRMTHSEETYFASHRSYRLHKNTFSPFNSQATLWIPESYPLMFLPIGKTDRVTDILRGYISLASLWKGGSTLGYSSPVVYQMRNFHNLSKDFDQEYELYKYGDIWSRKFKEIKAEAFIDSFRLIIKLLVEEYRLDSINIEAYECFLSEINPKLY
jgi:hypothetical protein